MLLDNSGLLCLLNQEDRRQNSAVQILKDAKSRLTDSYVLAEMIPLCRTPGVSAQLCLAFMEDISNSNLVEVVWGTEAMHRSATRLLSELMDKEYSLCDAVSFVLM